MTRELRRVLTTTLTVAGVIAVLYVMYLLRQPLAWIVLAGFLAIAMSGPVNWFDRRMPRGLAIASAYLGLLLVPILLGAIVVPPIVSEASDFADELPGYVEDAQRQLRENQTFLDLDRQYQITDRVREQAAELPGRIGDAAGALGDLGLGVVNSAFAATTIILLSIFLVANGRRWVLALLTSQSPERRQRLLEVSDRMGQAVGNYVAGALAQAAVAGVTTFIVLTLLGTPFAAPLAILVALFDLLPLVGATIGAVLVGVVTLVQDFPVDTLIWTAWAIGYQQIENNVIQPQIQKRAVGVHPFGVIVAVLFGATLFGVVGAILAVPVAATIQIAIEEAREWRRNAPGAGPAEAEPGALDVPPVAAPSTPAATGAVRAPAPEDPEGG